ncbi:MAG TPA: HNH endonuclease signature motif containing protein, partial [Beutenbergiaceae bacterium]|nr:HNH endonuclease signature motif containing protein [Beutenbergiaceae bacterium]
MTISPEAPHATPIGNTPIDAALGTAQEEIHKLFSRDVPFGAEDEILDQATRAWQVIDQMKLTMAQRLAQLESSGALLERGGQRTLATWITHAFGMNSKEALNLARVAGAFHHQNLPETEQEFWAGNLSLGEAGLIARVAERETKKRDVEDYPDAGVYTQMLDVGLMSFKRKLPETSAAALDRAGRDLGARLNPTRCDEDEKRAHTERGAALHQTLDGAFVLRAWGGAADAELLKAALEAFGPPPTHVGDRQERTYDGLVNTARYALGHQACAEGPGTTSRVNITVPWTTLVGIEGDDPAITDTGQVLSLVEVRSLLGESVIRRLVTDPASGKVLAVDSHRRVVSSTTRAAAFHGHTTCAWAQGCNVPVRFAQADHRVEFHRGGSSKADNIQPLCSTHNRLKHRLQVTKERRFWKGRARMSSHPEAPNPYPPPDPPDPPGKGPVS